jgi:hypothetical protein
LGIIVSSEKYKENIIALENQTQKVMCLRPVSFIFKRDQSKKMQYGLIAEEVEQIYPELTVPDREGKTFTLNYIGLIPILLAEIQNLIRSNEEQKEINIIHENLIKELKSKIT